MATLASWNQNKLFCSVRRTWVKATPEEKVRQRWLTWMIERGGYPLALLAVEKQLTSLSLSEKRSAPSRRADIVAFTSCFTPLLIVECKAIALTAKAIDQVKAYNNTLYAPFLALVNEREAMTGIYQREEGGYHFSPGFFGYNLLVEKISRLKSSESSSRSSERTMALSTTLANSRTLPGHG